MPQALLPTLPPPFPSDLTLLEERHRRWLTHRANQPLTDEERVTYHQTAAVPYALWQARMERMVTGILAPRNDRLTIWIEGPPGSGKTTFAIEVLLRVLQDSRERYGRVNSTADADDDINPVIAVKGSTGQNKDFMSALLRAIDLPEDRTAERMLGRFATYCQRHFVRVLLIDDVHVTNSREASVENFYKRILDIVPCVIFTAVDFNQSPVPRPGYAPTRRAATLRQLWGRALHEHPHASPGTDPAWVFASEDSGTETGRDALAGAVVDAGRALRLTNQAGSDLTSVRVSAALAALHQGSVGAILKQIFEAGADAVGQSERVGSHELGLTTPTPGPSQ